MSDEKQKFVVKEHVIHERGVEYPYYRSNATKEDGTEFLVVERVESNRVIRVRVADDGPRTRIEGVPSYTVDVYPNHRYTDKYGGLAYLIGGPGYKCTEAEFVRYYERAMASFSYEG